MKRHIAKWLDRILDGANPIVVRDLRRFRFFPTIQLYAVWILIYWVLALIVFIAQKDFFGISPESLEALHITLGLIGIMPLSFFFIFGNIFVPTLGLMQANIDDEMLGHVPMSPAGHLHGHLALSLISLSCSFFLFPPFFLCKDTLSSLHDTLFKPFQFVLYYSLFSMAGACFLLSFFVRVKSENERFLAFFCILIGLIFLGLPSLIVLNHPSTPDFNLTRWAGFLYYWAFIPGIMFSIALAGYLLSLYHFSRSREPFWRSIVVNWLVCLMLGVFYAIIVFVAHLMRILSPFGS